MIHTFLNQISIHVIEIAPDYLDQIKRNSINRILHQWETNIYLTIIYDLCNRDKCLRIEFHPREVDLP